MAADEVDSSIHQYYWSTGYYQDNLLFFFFENLKFVKLLFWDSKIIYAFIYTELIIMFK